MFNTRSPTLEVQYLRPGILVVGVTLEMRRRSVAVFHNQNSHVAAPGRFCPAFSPVFKVSFLALLVKRTLFSHQKCPVIHREVIPLIGPTTYTPRMNLVIIDIFGIPEPTLTGNVPHSARGTP